VTTFTLPGIRDVGRDPQHWTLPAVDMPNSPNIVPTPDSTAFVTFEGTFLGFGTTRKPTHLRHHGAFADPALGEKCNACRWSEIRIFYSKEDDIYLIHLSGISVASGESNRYRIERAVSALEVIEILTTNRQGEAARLSAPASRALAQAAEFDEDLREAYGERRARL